MCRAVFPFCLLVDVSGMILSRRQARGRGRREGDEQGTCGLGRFSSKENELVWVRFARQRPSERPRRTSVPLSRLRHQTSYWVFLSLPLSQKGQRHRCWAVLRGSVVRGPSFFACACWRPLLRTLAVEKWSWGGLGLPAIKVPEELRRSLTQEGRRGLELLFGRSAATFFSNHRPKGKRENPDAARLKNEGAWFEKKREERREKDGVVLETRTAVTRWFSAS